MKKGDIYRITFERGEELIPNDLTGVLESYSLAERITIDRVEDPEYPCIVRSRTYGGYLSKLYGRKGVTKSSRERLLRLLKAWRAK